MKQFLVLLLFAFTFVGSASAALADGHAGNALLTSLAVEDITVTGNAITPKFSPQVKEYTMNVESDIYGVKVIAQAVDGASVTIDGQPATAEGNIVKLSQEYKDYDVAYAKKVDVVVSKGEMQESYNITIKRENYSDVYALFKEMQYVDAETGVVMPYMLYLPKNYDKNKKYPVVLALHGSGQRGQSLDMVLKRYKLATVWAADSEKGKNECIVIAPQAATKAPNENWTTLQEYRKGVNKSPYLLSKHGVAAYNLLKKAMAEYSIDKDRVYLTGLSAGGFGSYTLATMYPETFAAVSLSCGGLDPAMADKLKGMPLWIFHAEGDPFVNVQEYYDTSIAALKKAGVDFKTTLYGKDVIFTPNAHFSWTPMYTNEEMRNWLFEQSKKN